MKKFIKIISVIVIISFLYSNIVCAGGLPSETLAPDAKAILQQIIQNPQLVSNYLAWKQQKDIYREILNMVAGGTCDEELLDVLSTIVISLIPGGRFSGREGKIKICGVDKESGKLFLEDIGNEDILYAVFWSSGQDGEGISVEQIERSGTRFSPVTRRTVLAGIGAGVLAYFFAKLRIPVGLPTAQARERIPQDISIPVEKFSRFNNANTNPETGLPYSHIGDESLQHWSFTYDVAMTAMSYIVTGQTDLAKKILDYYLTHSGIWKDGGIITCVDASRTDGKGVEWRIHTGPNAFIAIAAAQLYQKTQDRKYLDLSEKLAGFVEKLQNMNAGDGNYGAVRMGPDGRGLAYHFDWKDTNAKFYNSYCAEHNVDCYALFNILHKITGKEKYKTKADAVVVWLKRIYDTQRHCIQWGTYEKDYIDPDTKKKVSSGQVDPKIPLDANAWAISALGPELLEQFEPEAAKKMLAMIETQFVSETTVALPSGRSVKVRGVDYVSRDYARTELRRGPMVSFEWTIELANAYLRTGDEKNWKRVLDGIMPAADSANGGLAFPYATRYGAPIGWGWSTPKKRYSIIGSVYAVMSLQKADPLLPDFGPRAEFSQIPVYPLAGSVVQEKRAKPVIKTTLKECIGSARRAYGARQYETAISKIRTMFQKHSDWLREGNNQNEERRRKGGFASGTDEIHSYWALNDIGTGYFIIIMCLDKLGKLRVGGSFNPEALTSARAIVDSYTFSQCWDPKGWFWKPVEALKNDYSDLYQTVTKVKEQGTELLPDRGKGIQYRYAELGREFLDYDGRLTDQVERARDDYRSGNYGEVVSAVDSVLRNSDWLTSAYKQQAGKIELGGLLYTQSQESNFSDPVSLRFWALNHYAEFLALRAKALFMQGDRQASLATVEYLVKNFSMAQIWDEDSKCFWNPINDWVERREGSPCQMLTGLFEQIKDKIDIPGIQKTLRRRELLSSLFRRPPDGATSPSFGAKTWAENELEDLDKIGEQLQTLSGLRATGENYLVPENNFNPQTQITVGDNTYIVRYSPDKPYFIIENEGKEYKIFAIPLTNGKVLVSDKLHRVLVEKEAVSSQLLSHENFERMSNEDRLKILNQIYSSFQTEDKKAFADLWKQMAVELVLSDGTITEMRPLTREAELLLGHIGGEVMELVNEYQNNTEAGYTKFSDVTISSLDAYLLALMLAENTGTEIDADDFTTKMTKPGNTRDIVLKMAADKKLKVEIIEGTLAAVTTARSEISCVGDYTAKAVIVLGDQWTAADDPGMPGDTPSAVLARGSMPRASVDPKDRTLTRSNRSRMSELIERVAIEVRKIVAESTEPVECSV